MNIDFVGDGDVYLIAGGGEIYTDKAARLVSSTRDLEDIIASPYSKKLVKNIIDKGHEAAIEFDWFIFGVEGYSRVTEVQLVRKRLASYMIKSGRVDKDGKRSFDMVVPEDIMKFRNKVKLSTLDFETKDGTNLSELIDEDEILFHCEGLHILNLIEGWYNKGVELGLPEEDLRYLKPQATEFKALIGMNARGLRDWFKIRCCKNAQDGIRDLANKILKICKDTAPDLFEDAGPNCVRLGYCPENDMQHEDCKGKIVTKNKAMKIIKEHNQTEG